MSDFVGVVGVFEDVDGLREAVARAPRAGLIDCRPYLPLGDQRAVDASTPGGSLVTWVATAGGVTGIAAGLFITIWMSTDFRLITGGKPIIAWPPFLVICFELMVLFGVLATISGFLFFARLPDLSPSAGYRRFFAEDRFGLFIPCGEESVERDLADRILRESGASEVQAAYGANHTTLEEVP